MYLESIHLVNFKNYIDAEVVLSDRINCFIGINGVGKTNILDAVHYLSVCKSYMNSIDRQNIRFDESFFVIQGTWLKNNKKNDINCAVKIGSKKVFKKNKKEYEKLADHIGQFPVVMISPYDRDLILEGSNLRRKWMDGIIAQFDRNYLEALQKYSKVLSQRNALLKDMNISRLFDQESIDVWDVELVKLGNHIHEKRKVFLEEFIPVFQKHYDSIGSNKENVRIIYKSQLNESNFENLLIEFQKKDLITSFSNVGVHKDDLLFQIKNHSVKKFGSQGQQKSFIIALRLAQYEWLKAHLGVAPILLLDDVFDKLDQFRVQKLITLVANNFFGQVLVTDTDLERIQAIFSKSNLDSRIFLVDDGKITKYKEEIFVDEEK